MLIFKNCGFYNSIISVGSFLIPKRVPGHVLGRMSPKRTSVVSALTQGLGMAAFQMKYTLPCLLAEISAIMNAFGNKHSAASMTRVS